MILAAAAAKFWSTRTESRSLPTTRRRAHAIRGTSTSKSVYPAASLTGTRASSSPRCATKRAASRATFRSHRAPVDADCRRRLLRTSGYGRLSTFTSPSSRRLTSASTAHATHRVDARRAYSRCSPAIRRTSPARCSFATPSQTSSTSRQAWGTLSRSSWTTARLLWRHQELLLPSHLP